MNIHVDIRVATTHALYEEAQRMRDALLVALQTIGFEDAFAVSDWLHRTYTNPRLLVRTNEKGTTITVNYRTNLTPEDGLPLLRISL